MLYKRVLSLVPLSFQRIKIIRRHLSREKKTTKNITIEMRDSVALIGIDRVKSRNSLNSETVTELSSAFNLVDQDEKVKIIVLHGINGTFCSGFDVDEVNEKGYEHLVDVSQRLCQVPLTNKPLIGAIDGFAVAEGFELALACDLRVIEDTSAMGFLGRRFGCPHGLNGGTRLSALVGQSQAMDLTLTGHLINGNRAFEMGLVARLVATGCALGQAMDLALSVIRFPSDSMIYDKLQIEKSFTEGQNRQRVEEKLENIRPQLDNVIKEKTQLFKDGLCRHGKMYDTWTQRKKHWEFE